LELSKVFTTTGRLQRTYFTQRLLGEMYGATATGEKSKHARSTTKFESKPEKGEPDKKWS